LLTERPGYGYGLVPRLKEFHFGHIDRPAVYRALAQLELDGLVSASDENPTAGASRRVYDITDDGQRVLRVWMGVIKEECDYLGQALRRYQTTGTSDAVLAEVDGGWTSALSTTWSPVSSTTTVRRRLMPVGPEPDSDFDRRDGEIDWDSDLGAAPRIHIAPETYQLVPDRSAVLIEVRSTVGPISFGTIGISGFVRASVVDGLLRTESVPSGRIDIDVSRLNSGNKLYDAELLRRIDARRFPSASVELRECQASGPGARYRLSGDLTIHGVTKPVDGTVTVEAMSNRRLVVTGEQVFDIRDFNIPSPTLLMLRIYPDVRVRLQAEAELQEDL
jgi:DNA-binding PadR family transcriptional regulator